MDHTDKNLEDYFFHCDSFISKEKFPEKKPFLGKKGFYCPICDERVEVKKAVENGEE